jgi:hypothetical protein
MMQPLYKIIFNGNKYEYYFFKYLIYTNILQ